jgi:hypothetical protein
MYQEYVIRPVTFWPLVQPLLFWKGGMVKAKRTTPIAEIIKADKLHKAAVTGLTRKTRGNPVPVVPATIVKVAGLVSDQGVIPVTAQCHTLGQASDPHQTGNRG